MRVEGRPGERAGVGWAQAGGTGGRSTRGSGAGRRTGSGRGCGRRRGGARCAGCALRCVRGSASRRAGAGSSKRGWRRDRLLVELRFFPSDLTREPALSPLLCCFCLLSNHSLSLEPKPVAFTARDAVSSFFSCSRLASPRPVRGNRAAAALRSGALGADAYRRLTRGRRRSRRYPRALLTLATPDSFDRERVAEILFELDQLKTDFIVFVFKLVVRLQTAQRAKLQALVNENTASEYAASALRAIALVWAWAQNVRTQTRTSRASRTSARSSRAP